MWLAKIIAVMMSAAAWLRERVDRHPAGAVATTAAATAISAVSFLVMANPPNRGTEQAGPTSAPTAPAKPPVAPPPAPPAVLPPGVSTPPLSSLAAPGERPPATVTQLRPRSTGPAPLPLPTTGPTTTPSLPDDGPDDDAPPPSSDACVIQLHVDPVAEVCVRLPLLGDVS
ncbi:hypothetical protein EWH70_32320 [Amycolatopsis suaedae]|uniref:Uncharacterized protein n=2 Tax=Amycolatopsis suaedae TaxID=2510978 RepID=A0A4Q7J0B3_9PSEU|nr:hypothetical protein EWH70_32320 [Amycolatopsis suaedae]